MENKNFDSINILSEQYQHRVTLIIEILKMYFRILLIFAIALLACVAALIKVEEYKTMIINFAFLSLKPIMDGEFCVYGCI